MISRYCKFCKKLLNRTQTKYCCKAHYLQWEREHTHCGRLSGSKKVKIVNRKPMGLFIE